MNKWRRLAPWFRLSKKNIKRYTALWLVALCTVSTLTWLLLISPSHLLHKKLLQQVTEKKQHIDHCKTQRKLKKALQQQRFKWQQSVAFEGGILMSTNDWQSQLLQWLKRHNIHVTQIESNEANQDNKDSFQLNANSSWHAFLQFFDDMQRDLPLLAIPQLEIQPSTSTPSIIHLTCTITVYEAPHV